MREPTRNPIPPEEEAFLSASLEHVVTLEHADHPEEPITHLRPHLTNIQLALQTGNPVPHHPPRMAELEEVQAHEREEINVTRTQPEPVPVVQPRNDEEGNGKGGRVSRLTSLHARRRGARMKEKKKIKMIVSAVCRPKGVTAQRLVLRALF